MPDRHDALAAASEIILGVENAALETGSVDTVATVGMCEVFPGAINSIPSKVTLGIDVRDTDRSRRDRVLVEIQKKSAEVSRRRQMSVERQLLNSDDPAVCDPRLIETISLACREAGLPFKNMVSRAYHDSLFMSRLSPVGMIFIPCRNGYSHRPDEFASPEAISDSVRILAGTLAECAR